MVQPPRHSLTTRLTCVGLSLAIQTLVLCIAALPTRAVEPVTIPLWENGAPQALGKEAKDVPQLIVYALETNEPTGALVILPGGGYGGLAMDHEGHQIARWANEMGMSAFICDYRHRGKGYGHPHPLQDAQRAIRTVRFNKDKWKIDPSRVGIIGFSAGGHLCSTTLTHFDPATPVDKDPINELSARPDFGILCYPVIDFEQSYTHKGSQRNLLGENADPELIKSLSNSTQVTKQTPPTFLWHTLEDTAVPVENSLKFYSALATNGVLSELHSFPKGRHGLGLAAGAPGAEQWPALCRAWLRGLKVIK